jgi:hypothetical protein
VALQDPKLIHAEQRIKAKKFSIYGVEIGSVQKMQENGRKLADYRATIHAQRAEESASRLQGAEQSRSACEAGSGGAIRDSRCFFGGNRDAPGSSCPLIHWYPAWTNGEQG